MSRTNSKKDSFDSSCCRSAQALFKTKENSQWETVYTCRSERMISSRANAYRFRALRTIGSFLSRESAKGNRLQHNLPQQQLNSLIASNHHHGNFISRSFSHPSRETLSESNNEVFSATSDEQSILNLASVISNLERASKFNQGKGGGPNSPKSMWNLEFVRNTVEQYEQLLRYFYL